METNSRSVEEIKDRIAALENDPADFFGYIRSDLINYLPFDEAKPYLKDGVTSEQWKPQSTDRDSIVKDMGEYMAFAWDKANNCRGLSAGRSINHVQAWLWMLREDKAAEAISEYDLYGKPQLRAVCERYGIDWREYDSGQWKRGDYDEGAPPPAETIALPFATGAA